MSKSILLSLSQSSSKNTYLYFTNLEYNGVLNGREVDEVGLKGLPQNTF